MSPIEDAHSQQKEDHLAKLESDVELQVIPDHFLFIHEVASLVLCLWLSRLIVGSGTAALVSLDVATRED